MQVSSDDITEYCRAIEHMTTAMSSARESLKALREDVSFSDTKSGISLLSLKHHTLLAYLQSLVILAPRRTLSHSLTDRTLPSKIFSTFGREVRGSNAGDLVDSMIEQRIILEKMSGLEARMRYQIEKLVRLAEEPESNLNVENDPLAFRPNPQNLTAGDASRNHEALSTEAVSTEYHDKHDFDDEIYRPPRLAPVPYTEKSTRKGRAPIPSALASLPSDPSRPHMETTSGLGGIPTLASGRAAYLKRLNDYEEENFSRVVMKKSDAKRRARDEENIALGGDLGGGGHNIRRRAGGLEDEFGDVLKSVSRVTSQHGQGQRDGYEELRRKGKKANVLERSRDDGRRREDASEMKNEDGGDGQRATKRSRFEQETKIARTKLSKRKKNQR